MDITNYINAEIYIKEEDINKNIRIINSFENYKKDNEWEEEVKSSVNISGSNSLSENLSSKCSLIALLSYILIYRILIHIMLLT